MDANELADAIGGSVNSGIDVTEFQDAVQREHNYLQRVMFRQVLKPGIIALAAQDYTDARNEAVVAECREVCDAMGWDY